MILGLIILGIPAEAEPAKLDFTQTIRPILSDTCFHCHGPDARKRKAELRLDTFEGATMDLGGYAAIVPGDPVASVLLKRFSRSNAASC